MKILNSKELINIHKKLNLKELSADELVITNVDDIYDGPLSGSCEWKGKEYFFYSLDQLADDESEDPFPSKYILFSKKESQGSEFKIEEEDIVGWFSSVSKNKAQATKFLKSYFDWKNK